MENNTIIAFIDDSKYSEIVCEYAAWLALESKSKIKVYHVIDKKIPPAKQDLSGAINLGAKTKLLSNLSEVDAEDAKKLHSIGWSILEKANQKIQSLGDLEVETRLRTGDIAEALKVKEGLADVVVIGKRGELKQDNDSKLGLNIERLVRSSKKPIFIANRKFVTVKKVLVAFDGSPSAKRIIDFISTCGFFNNAQITLASVGKPEKEIDSNFSEAKKVLNSQNIEVAIKSLSGDPKFELSKLAKDNNFDLLIMGAYGHSKIRSYIVGSTTTRLINTVRLPVLLIR